jgi:hypothetical protein
MASYRQAGFPVGADGGQSATSAAGTVTVSQSGTTYTVAGDYSNLL